MDMRKLRHLSLIIGFVMTTTAGAASVDETDPGKQAERHISPDQPLQVWSQDPNRLDGEKGDRLEVRQVPDEKLETVKLKNVVAPIRFESGVARSRRTM